MESKKILYSIIVPCYNGQFFLEKSLHSIINKNIVDKKLTHLYEIIIINDGSTDKSLKIAKDLAVNWNSQIRDQFIRVINKKNGQYGSVINRGIKEAQGIYFKVLDVDDTFNSNNFIKMLYIIASLSKQVDVIITDYTFEKVGVNKIYLKTFRNVIEPNKMIDTNLIALPRDIITMHSIIYRRQFLLDLHYKQTEKIYYTDSEYAILPLLKVKAFYYINLPLYRYYIGRNEQSITMANMVKNREHQMKVLIKIWKNVDLEKLYSKKMTLYATIALRRLAQWQVLLIVNSQEIKNKRKFIMDFFDLLRSLQPKYHKLIMRGAFFAIFKLTRGYGASKIIKYGSKIYSKFKTNILSDWG